VSILPRETSINDHSEGELEIAWRQWLHTCVQVKGRYDMRCWSMRGLITKMRMSLGIVCQVRGVFLIRLPDMVDLNAVFVQQTILLVLDADVALD
jgi:hypothetical protein